MIDFNELVSTSSGNLTVDGRIYVDYITGWERVDVVVFGAIESQFINIATR